MNRTEMLHRVAERRKPWDLLVIGGGATGVGIAVDAAARGYEVVLVEQSDFGKGTSSRSTKLVHGGVRYLQQGNVALVMEALKERGILRQNAPHLVSDLRFIVPNYDWWEAPFYGIGLKIYDLLARTYGFGPSRLLSKEQTIAHLPTIEPNGLRGGVQYFDGQFDDARLLISLALTAVREGAVLVNYMPVVRLRKAGDGFLSGAVAMDAETGTEYEIAAKAVVNATGPFADSILRLDDSEARPLIAPSQGIHLVLDKAFLPADSAIMVPHTRDGRVMFAIPWHGHALIGTTDTPVAEARLEPEPQSEEVDFILETAADYLHQPPQRRDVRSVFAGIRPLVDSGGRGATSALSRDHTVQVSRSGLVTICGGKWTTYRKMAEDTVDCAATIARLEERPCPTRQLRLHGYDPNPGDRGPLAVYGADAGAVRELTQSNHALGQRLHPALPYTQAEVVWGCRKEMARTVDDVLSRRTRALVLNAPAALAAAPVAAALLGRELGRDLSWQNQQIKDFEKIAAHAMLWCP
jgi:glycerol-3-phosphate dehydrogenase